MLHDTVYCKARFRTQKRHQIIVQWICACILFLMPCGTQASSVATMTNAVHLFTDTALVQSMSGLSLRLHSPTPSEITLVYDDDWDRNIIEGYPTVFRDGDRYRLYYSCFGDQHESA